MTSPVFVDLYAEDIDGKPHLDALVKAGLPWAGLGLKASEGTYYPSGHQADWFNTYWPATKFAAGSRYGKSFYRYAYHYYRVGEDPAQQAQLFLKTIENAGGWGLGDLWPMIDVESAENPSSGSHLPAQVEDEVTELANYLFTEHGRKPVLYGGSYLRDLGITSHMGCQYFSTAIYGLTLNTPSQPDTRKFIASMGWSMDQLLSWQYQGTDGWSGPSHYPRICPMASTPLDLSAMICGGSTQDEQLAWIAANINH
jgi:GH25 family lysozyme M1 (1,4-beta-N-acetylmuramidase)